MSSQKTWRIIYYDGNNNAYRFWKASEEVLFEYTPVTPESSSSGVYSGGEPQQGILDTKQAAALWQWVEQLMSDTSTHSQKRMKGTGSINLSTDEGTRKVILKNGARLRAFDEFMTAFRES